MNDRARSARPAFLVALLLTVGCLGTESGNPPFAPTQMGLRSSQPDEVSLADRPGVAVVERAFLALGSVEVGDSPGLDPDFAPGFIDLLEGMGGRLPTGEFRDLTLRLDPSAAPPVGAPVELAGHTLFLSGVRADGVPFEIRSTAASLVIEAADPAPTYTVSGDAAYYLAFDAARWLAIVDLTTIPVDVDGVARVAPGVADGRLDVFDAMAQTGIELFSDLNMNAILDPEDVTHGRLAHGR